MTANPITGVYSLETTEFAGEGSDNTLTIGSEAVVNLSGNALPGGFNPEGSSDNNVVNTSGGVIATSSGEESPVGLYGGYVFGDFNATAAVSADNNTVNVTGGALSLHLLARTLVFQEVFSGSGLMHQ